jgi:hypothetical protein
VEPPLLVFQVGLATVDDVGRLTGCKDAVTNLPPGQAPESGLSRPATKQRHVKVGIHADQAMPAQAEQVQPL